MPIGNGRVAANVFVEDNATLGLLLSSQEAYLEDGELAKVGWLRVNMSPPPGEFDKMRLDVNAATVWVYYKGGAKFSVFAHASTDTFVIDVSSPTKIDIAVEATLARPKRKDKYLPPFDCTHYNVSADEGIAAEALASDSFGWYHRNANSSYLHSTTSTELFKPPADLVDPLKDRQTGAVVFTDRARHRPGTIKPPGFPLRLDSAGPASAWTVGVSIVTQEAGSAEGWLAKARQAIQAGLPNRNLHLEWWKAFWARSHIVLEETDEEQRTVSTQYTLQRYIQAIQARRNKNPIKFNGMLFTANKPPNEDVRQWGGLNWWQNLRLPYYNMLASGDGDMLQTLLDGFVYNMPLAIARSKAYWPRMEQPALFLPEYTHPLLGTTHPRSYSYGCNRNASGPEPPWYSEDPWNHYNHQGALDLSLLALDHFAHTGNDTTLKATLPLIDAILHWFAQRWLGNPRDANGKIVLWPTQALETWQCPGYPPPKAGATCPSNDLPTIAGLHKVTERVLAIVPTSISTAKQRERWAALQGILPPLPVGPTPPHGSNDIGGAVEEMQLRPCDVCPAHTSNVENAELYAVHPYRVYGIGRPTNLTLALNAWKHKPFPSDVGWNQNAMDAAMLGLADDAAKMVLARAKTPPAKGYRFPVFAPHEQDYEPSADHFAVMSNALTYMLIQTLDDANATVLLLPAWPCRWSVSFKLHAPRRTIIEGAMKNGSLISLTVTPESRRADVRVAKCQ